MANAHRKENLPYIRSFRTKVRHMADDMRTLRHNLEICQNVNYLDEAEKLAALAIGEAMRGVEDALSTLAKRAAAVVSIMEKGTN